MSLFTKHGKSNPPLHHARLVSSGMTTFLSVLCRREEGKGPKSSLAESAFSHLRLPGPKRPPMPRANSGNAAAGSLRIDSHKDVH